MKKVLLSLVALLAMSVSAWADGVTVPSPTRIAASRFSKLKVTLESTTPYRDLQFDLTLPAGITLKDEAGGTVVDEASNHVLQYNAEGSTIHFVVVDAVINASQNYDSETFPAAEKENYGKTLSNGVIVEIPINAAATFTGEQQATLANMKVSKDDGTNFNLTDGTFNIKAVLLGDVDDDGKVTVNDALWIAEYSIELVETGFVEEAAYVDTNETIDVNDAVRAAEISLEDEPSSVKKRFEENLRVGENDELDPE